MKYMTRACIFSRMLNVQFFCNAGIWKKRNLLLGKGALEVFPNKIPIKPRYRKSILFVKNEFAKIIFANHTKANNCSKNTKCLKSSV